VHETHAGNAHLALSANGTNLPSHLADYHVPTTTTTLPAAAPTTTTTAVAPTTTSTTPPAPTTTTTDPPPPAPTTTTTTAPPPPVAAAQTNDEDGEATWYSEAASGMCASPTLPFGTVLTVVNDATGASTGCTVDDREEAGYPRVVDMSPEGFAQIGDLSQGVVEVTISW
jgi:rare lipoprotein A (peptidoglycan hydrolase)